MQVDMPAYLPVDMPMNVPCNVPGGVQRPAVRVALPSRGPYSRQGVTPQRRRRQRGFWAPAAGPGRPTWGMRRAARWGNVDGDGGGEGGGYEAAWGGWEAAGSRGVAVQPPGPSVAEGGGRGGGGIP